MPKRKPNPSPHEALNPQRQLGEIFKSFEEMADSLEALLEFLNRRYRQGASEAKAVSILGFALEKVTVEFSEKIETIEIETRFASDTVRIIMPSLPQESKDEQRVRSLTVIDRLLPALKETHMRAAGHFYHFLDPMARQRMVESYKQRFPGKE